MVRTYILTDRERQILQRFLETGEKLNGFSVLAHHLRKAEKQLMTDLVLVQKTIEKEG